METPFLIFCLFLLFFAPVLLAVVFIIKKRRVLRAQTRAPFNELKRRPPGEYLRLKLESIDEEINSDTMLLVGFPFILAVAGACLKLPGLVFNAVGCLFSIGWAVFFGMRLYRLIEARANHQLGFAGERYVAEELNQSIANGFQIYHDVPFDGYNVDHVLVGPGGVFSVETKTYRKPVSEQGSDHQVEFDGHSLSWPWGKSTREIEQAENNARTVARWLTGAVGETVAVTPILTLPGWFVERKSPAKAVYVVNPMEIKKFVNSVGQSCDEKLVRRICHQLNQKCALEIE